MMKTRAARPDEIEALQADLAKDKRWEQVDLQRGIVCVTELDGEPVMMSHARLVWQIEPTKFLYGKRKKLNAFQQAKATLLTIRWIEEWLRDRKHNPLIRKYLTFIPDHNTVMQKLAAHFGMAVCKVRGKFFAKDL